MKHIIAILLLCLSLSFTTAQANTSTITFITNHVSITYIDPISGTLMVTRSNTIQFKSTFLITQGQKLALSKQVSSSEAMFGDLLTYTLTINNQTGEAVQDAHVYDHFPQGFKLVARTVHLNDEIRDDIVTLSANSIDFNLGELAKDSEQVLSYSLRVSTLSTEGDAINSAYLTAKTRADEPLQSATTHAKVQINNNGVLSNKGILFGKVHFDKRCDYVTDREQGLLSLGGIRLYLDDGRYAITDGAGDYSFYALQTGLHTIKLDTLTLPNDVQLKVVSPQQANDPSSYFIDISAGDFQRADFVAECLKGKSTDKILKLIKEKSESLRDTDLLDKSGSKAAVNGNIYSALNTDKKRGKTPSAPKNSTKDTMPTSKKVAKTITYQQAKKGTWLWPTGKTSTDGRFMAVVRASVKEPVLYVNDEAIAIENLGEQFGNKKARAQVLAWYGIKLKDGENKLVIKGIDSRGKMRTLAKGVFIKPSKGTSIKITAPKEALIADGGRSSLPLKITILDENGYPVAGDYFVTLQASEGEWVEKDIQSATKGQQVKISDGEGVVHLRSSNKTGKIHITVKADVLQGKTDVLQVAHLRPLFASGYLNIGNAQQRAKIFLKGKVLDDKHLTLSFDSDKTYADDNDAYGEERYQNNYPLHGDASARGYEARSRDTLYAKLEKGRDSIMWGDYKIQGDNNDLAKVQRSLTGINANVEIDDTNVQVFAAYKNDNHITEEFRGNGTASQYQLSKTRLIPNTETIEVIIRDRDNTGLVISTETLQHLIDYTVDPVTGYLTFQRTIASLDEDLNPVYIRVSYNVESNGEDYLVSGAHVAHTLSDEVRLGVSYTQDDHIENGHTLRGGYMTYQPSNSKTKITASIADMTHNNETEKGSAYRFSIKHQWAAKTATNITLGSADKGFTNSNSGIREDRQELKITHTHQLDKYTRLKIKGIRSKTLSVQQQKQSVSALLQTRVGKWALEGGIQHLSQQTDYVDASRNTALVGVKRGFKIGEHSVQVGTHYAQDIDDSALSHITAKIEVAVTKDTSVYTRYEAGNDLKGSLGFASETESTQWVFGAKTRLTPKMELYSEFRSFDFTGTRSAETSTGFRGSINIEKGLSITPSLEVVKVTEGENLQDAIAASMTIKDSRDKNHRKSLRVETRQGENSDSYTLDGRYLARFDDVWSGLVKEELRVTIDNTGSYGNSLFTLGLTQRQRDDGQHNSLYLYQWKEDWGINKRSHRTVHLLSTHQHYQVDDYFALSARLGGKIQTLYVAGEEYRIDTILLDGKILYELNDKMDVFIRAGLLASEHFNERQHSVGTGISVTLKENLRVSVGYNQSGFNDEDLDHNKLNKEGVFVNLRLKL